MRQLRNLAGHLFHMVQFEKASWRISVHISHFFRIVMFFGVAIVSTGCTEQSYRYSARGIGPSLYAPDIAKATDDQNTYLGYLCDQTDYAAARSGRAYPQCQLTAAYDARWNLVVHTGFNDIDRRCDAYLAWVDDLRRRAIFGNEALEITRSFTNFILDKSLSPGAVAIGIVGEAFGYSSGLFNEYNRLVLLGYEGSTIEAIVSSRRTAFRSEIAQNVKVLNKPDTVNILRSYLRICMPYTISMNANEFARAITTDSVPSSIVDDSKITETLVEVTYLDRNEANFKILKNYVGTSDQNARKAKMCAEGLGLSETQFFAALTPGDENLRNRLNVLNCLKKANEL